MIGTSRAATILTSTLKTPFEYAIAYGIIFHHLTHPGSGALAQAGQTSRPAMLDYILAVRDPLEWHNANMKANPLHYSLSGRLCLPFIQNSAAGIYYNTHIPPHPSISEPGLLIKYGVVGIDTLVEVRVLLILILIYD
jgi:translocator assembly and maintenance protein 41